MLPEQDPLCTAPSEQSGPLAKNAPLTNSLQHNNLVLKFIPMPQAMKILAAKAAVDKEWEKLEKIFGVGT